MPAHDIPARERLIFALDVPSFAAARPLVERLGDAVQFYKIGLELAMSGEYFDLMRWLIERDKKVFADVKLYDIPATVARAVRQLARSGATFCTVHGERGVTEAAAAEKGDTLKILAVTVLTSVEQRDLEQVGITADLATLAMRRAEVAVASGCDGVIASGHEAAALRARLGPGPLIVTPGIRPAAQRGTDDQKRVMGPAEALRAGADYIVVGRPIRDAADPYAAAVAIQDEIAAAVA
ncbi:MAG TPA: orotidine-5'-phosphate decarboxylase [Gammaproteobacteria bacterium]